MLYCRIRLLTSSKPTKTPTWLLSPSNFSRSNAEFRAPRLKRAYFGPRLKSVNRFAAKVDTLLGYHLSRLRRCFLRCFQSCAFYLIVVAVQQLPFCIHKVHLAVAARKLVP